MTSNSTLSEPPASSRQTDAKPTKDNRSSSAFSSNDSSISRSRGSHRRQRTAIQPETSEISVEAKRRAAVILEVLAGVRTPAGAAAVLGTRLPRYYLWEERAVQGLVAACGPRPQGRIVRPDRQLARLERELALARRDLARHQALARTAQRVLGLPAPAEAHPSGATSGKGKGKMKSRDAPSGTRPRHRRPTVRALRAARLLRAGDSSGVNSPVAVQSGHGPSVAGTKTTAEMAAAAGERKVPEDLRVDMT
jgi:hypothetical protein